VGRGWRPGQLDCKQSHPALVG